MNTPINPDSKNNAATRSRAPEGFRNGGEFLTEGKSEQKSTSSLSRGTKARLGAFADILTEEQVTTLASSSKFAAKYWASKATARNGGISVGNSAEDIGQEAALQTLLTTLKKNDQVGEDGAPVFNPENIGAYVFGTAKFVSADTNHTGKRIPDSVKKARAIHNQWKEDFIHANGRSSTTVEQDAEAKKMNDNWEDRDHRPGPHFHREINGRSAPITLDAEQFDMLTTSVYPGSDNEAESFDPESYMAAALAAIDMKQESAKGNIPVDENGENAKVRQVMAEMRRDDGPNALIEAANASSDRNPDLADVPLVKPKHINPRKASVIRDTVSAAGGVQAVLRDWATVGDSEASAALFAPFGKLGFPEQEAVVEFLSSKHINKFNNGNGAETIWGHALTGATNRKRAGD